MSKSKPKYYYLTDADRVIRVFENGKMELYVKSLEKWEVNYVYGNIYTGDEPCKEITEKEAEKITERKKRGDTNGA